MVEPLVRMQLGRPPPPPPPTTTKYLSATSTWTIIVMGIVFVLFYQLKASPVPNRGEQKTRGGGGGARPKAVFFWTNLDVLKWLKRHCAELFPHYCHLFEQHDITGRSLVRMTDNNLERLGISDAIHRDEIWREILKLKLKCDILELRDLQNKSGNLAAN